MHLGAEFLSRLGQEGAGEARHALPTSGSDARGCISVRRTQWAVSPAHRACFLKYSVLVHHVRDKGPYAAHGVEARGDALTSPNMSGWQETHL